MVLPDQLKSKSAGELEEWFLTGLSAEKMPLAEMLTILSHLEVSGNVGQADDWAELMQEALCEHLDRNGILRLLELRCGRHEADPAFRQVCREVLSRVFKDRLGLALVASAGFDGSTTLKECLRRLQVLTKLEPGIFCYEKTWGLGVVERLDDFYRKVTIDFDRKPSHRMSFAYAGEALELISDDHLLVRKRRNPVELNELVRTDPAEVVRIALRSYGSVNVQRLKELLVDDILSEGSCGPETEWKNFWDSARKQLKADPLVDVPARRGDPIRLLQKEKEYGEEWFALLKRERDPEKILNLVEELEHLADTSGIRDEFRRVLGERLAFVVEGSEGKRPDLVVQAVMAAKRFGLSGEPVNVAGITESLMSADRFLSAAAGMSPSNVARFLKHIAEHDTKKTSDLLLSLLTQMPLNVLNEAVDFLISAGMEQDCTQVFRSVLASRKAGVQILYWLCRHLDLADSWSVVRLPELLIQAVDSLEESYSGESLRAQNQLRVLFDQKGWLEGVLNSLDGRQREGLLLKVRNSRGWNEAGRRSVMARMIRLYPELEKVMISGSQEAEVGTEQGRFTSWRSYRERMEQYRKLVEETIPENSREIAAARSYGDLSENYEYKAAKERQGMLLHRQHEIETDLKQVKGTDFVGLPTDKAGMGTCVAVCRPDGHTQRYYILGEWDHDENLGIISSRSKLAEMVNGHGVGDEVMLPAAGGEEPCRIIEVTGLSEKIRDWITG